MNYTDNLNFLAQDAGDPEYAVDPNFLIQLPFWIESAENRILRDLDLLSTYVEDATGRLSQSRRLFPLPTGVGTFQVLSTIRVVLPGPPIVVQPPLEPISREALDAFYPGGGPVGSPSVPKYWAPFDQSQIMVGPPPDQPYQVICYGTQYPASLNTQATLGSGSTGTYISNELPDLFHAAEMWLVCGWQRQFSGMADQADSAVSWENAYQNLLNGTNVLEARRRLASRGWSTAQPEQTATPPQT